MGRERLISLSPGRFSRISRFWRHFRVACFVLGAPSCVGALESGRGFSPRSGTHWIPYHASTAFSVRPPSPASFAVWGRPGSIGRSRLLRFSSLLGRFPNSEKHWFSRYGLPARDAVTRTASPGICSSPAAMPSRGQQPPRRLPVRGEDPSKDGSPLEGSADQSEAQDHELPENVRNTDFS